MLDLCLIYLHAKIQVSNAFRSYIIAIQSRCNLAVQREDGARPSAHSAVIMFKMVLLSDIKSAYKHLYYISEPDLGTKHAWWIIENRYEI